jgi:hypothetical protein
MRRITQVLLATVAALAITAPVGAATPEIIPGEPFEVEIPFPNVCSFEMVATVRGRTHTIWFKDASGKVVRGFSGGQLFVTWQRLDTGYSRTWSIAGPTFYDAGKNPIRGTGRWTTPLEGTGWVLANGNLTLEGFEDGFSLIVDYRGNATAICDLMSGTA